MTTNQTETLHIDFPDISNGIKMTYSTISTIKLEHNPDRHLSKTVIFNISKQNTNTEVSNAVIKWTGDAITDIKINFISGISAAYTKAIYNTILTICNEH